MIFLLTFIFYFINFLGFYVFNVNEIYLGKLIVL